MAILGILATAQTIVIVSGGLDISVGAVVGPIDRWCIALGVQADRQSPALGIGCSDCSVRRRSPEPSPTALIVTYGPGQCRHRNARHHGGIPRRRLHHVGRAALSASFTELVPPHRQRCRWLGLQITIRDPDAPGRGRLRVRADALNTTVIGRNIYAIGGNPTRLPAWPALNNHVAIRSGSTCSRGVAAAGIGGLLLAARTGSGQPISGSDRASNCRRSRPRFLGGCALHGRQGHHHRRACSAC